MSIQLLAQKIMNIEATGSQQTTTKLWSRPTLERQKLRSSSSETASACLTIIFQYSSLGTQ